MGSFAASSYSLCSLQGTEGTASQRGSGLPVCCWKVADLLKSTNVKVLLCKAYILKCQGVALPCQPNASLCHKRTASCLTAFQVWMGQLLFIFFCFVLCFFLISFCYCRLGKGCLLCWRHDAYHSCTWKTTGGWGGFQTWLDVIPDFFKLLSNQTLTHIVHFFSRHNNRNSWL